MKCKKLLICVVCAICVACGPARIANLQKKQVNVALRLPSEEESQSLSMIDTINSPKPVEDLVVTDLEGNEVLIMKAVKDEESGEMVATEQIEAAYVRARFRNVAERNGKVNLEFQVIVPENLQNSKWQLRLYPSMFILEDSLRLDNVVVTGSSYRKEQLRGYQRYERFLSRIISDSLKFIDTRNLEIFISRNLPEIFAYKTDSSFVDEALFYSSFGVNYEDALEHYTRQYLLNHNERLLSMRERMWRKYVTMPIISDGIRLDTVIVGDNSEFIYNYIQTINTRPGLRKVDIVLDGEIFEENNKIYDVPRSDNLTFYISSVSSFVDDQPRYLTSIISRDLKNSSEAIIEFKTGKSELDLNLGNNAEVISLIKNNLREIINDNEIVLDSIAIIASSSPDGKEKANIVLSKNRAESVSSYFSSFVNYVKDSLKREDALIINLGEEYKMEERKTISFGARSGGENWHSLDYLVEIDTVLLAEQKNDYFALKTENELDNREVKMKSLSSFSYIQKTLYPKLRTVHFNMYMHRKGMIKDTIHTTVLDTNYMAGVQALKDHDYNRAITILSPYQDFNAALAFVALDRNSSAMNILKNCPKTAKVNYLLAIIYSRTNNDKKAVEAYLHSCQMDPSFVHRGNLDPEISILINKYKINNEPDFYY